jgi:hypothetical protein
MRDQKDQFLTHVGREHLDWDQLRELYLRTPLERREVALWALDTFEAICGPRWLQRAIDRDGQPAGFIALGPFHAGAFVELLEWAASLQLLADIGGMGRLRNAVRSDPRLALLLHASTQLELVRLAIHVGGTARLEPTLPGSSRPVDVELSTHGVPIPVEVRQLFTDRHWRQSVDFNDRFAWRVQQLEHRHQVVCAIDITTGFPETDPDTFLSRIEEAARIVASDGRRQEVALQGARASVSLNGAKSIRGPMRAGDYRRRLAHALQEKSAQHERTAGVWLRVDDRSGLWQFTGWAQQPLSEKLEHVRTIVRGELATSPSVAGVVLSSGALLAQGQFSNQTHKGPSGSVALRRLIAPSRVRETLVVPLTDSAANTVPVWHELYDAEPAWLASALSTLGQDSAARLLCYAPRIDDV